MVSMQFGGRLFGNFKRNYRIEFMDRVEQLALDSMVAFAEAAAEATPLYTGYSRAIWEGVIDYLQGQGATTGTFPDYSGAKIWYLPPYPIVNYSDIPLEYPEEQQTRGRVHGLSAVTITRTTKSGGISIRIVIPEPNERGGENYAINEPEWDTLGAGRMAFDNYFEANRDIEIGDLFEIGDF